MYHFATYTIQLVDAITQQPDLLENLTFPSHEGDPDNEFWAEQSLVFQEVFLNKFYHYELGVETPALFKEYITNVFRKNERYYMEYIKAYLTKIDMLEGYVESTTHTEKTTDKNSGTGDSTYIDLPMKNTSTEYASNKQNNNTSYNGSKDRELVVKHTGGVNTTEQKKKYLEIISNVYDMFCEDFKTCFMLLY